MEGGISMAAKIVIRNILKTRDEAELRIIVTDKITRLVNAYLRKAG